MFPNVSYLKYFWKWLCFLLLFFALVFLPSSVMFSSLRCCFDYLYLYPGTVHGIRKWRYGFCSEAFGEVAKNSFLFLWHMHASNVQDWNSPSIYIKTLRTNRWEQTVTKDITNEGDSSRNQTCKTLTFPPCLTNVGLPFLFFHPCILLTY